MKKIMVIASLFILISPNAFGVGSYSLRTKIKSVLIYPQPVTPGGVSYTEMLINIPQSMENKPNCAAYSTRFIIDSNNPMFPYVYGLVLNAQKEQLDVSINYWDQCESSGTHKAPLIRAITIL